MSASQANILTHLDVKREGNFYFLTGTLSWSVELSHPEAPVLLEREVEKMGQQFKRETYGQLLQEVDQQIVAQFQTANPNLQKRGSRSYTFVTCFGEVSIQRTRVFDTQAKAWSVPSQTVWETPHKHCLLPELKESARQTVQDLSVRKTSQAVSEQAGVEKLISPATVFNLFHEEGRQLGQAQQDQAQRLLEEHPQAIFSGLLGVLEEEKAEQEEQPEPQAIEAEDEAEAPCPDLTEGQLEEVRERAIGFLRPDSTEFQELSQLDMHDEEPPENDLKTTEEEGIAFVQMPSDEEPDDSPAEPAASEQNDSKEARPPRRVDNGFVVFQPDDVQTKAQATQEGKRNYTYTATVDTEDRTYYLAAGSAAVLWTLAAALLAKLGVTDGRRGLMVIADGARWIRNWYRGLTLPKMEMVLCWYHLTKRVYERLSQGGFSKERRQEIEWTVLGHLWRGERAQAVCYLWGVREEARNGFWITQLIEYLLARREYLPNYSARHEAGLWIASTRVEKWNDLAVSNRCKRRGMSWTKEGVLSLALHQANQRNDPSIWETSTDLSQAA